MHDYAASLLTGERLTFRALRSADLPLLSAWWNTPDWMVLQQASVVPKGAEATAKLFEDWSANDTEAAVGFSLQNDTGDLVGHVALWGITPRVRRATLAIMIGPPWVDQGYGTEAMAMLVRFGFEELGLNKIELNVWEFNERAIAVYERAGFTVEGRRRAAMFHAGTFWDEILMGILREEYDAQQS